MQWNGIKSTNFRLKDNNSIVELRYDSDMRLNGMYITKNNGVNWIKIADMDDLTQKIKDALTTVTTGLKTPISIALESGLPDLSTVTDWVASTNYAVGDLVYKDNTVYKCLTANSDATFTEANWDVFITDGTYYSVQDMDITHPNHTGRAWYNSAESKTSWQTQFDDLGTPIQEYGDYSVGDIIPEGAIITEDNIIYRALVDVTSQGAWNLDSSNFEELKTTGAILNNFQPNHYYAENEMIVENNVIYTRKTAGTSGTSLGNDIANWTPQTKMHIDGQRHVSFTLGTLPTQKSAWVVLNNFVFNDGDQAMLGTNYLIAPVDGLYYVNFNSFNLAAGAGRHILQVTKSNTDNLKDILCRSFGDNNASVTPSCVGIFHLQAGERLYVWIWTDNNISQTNTIPSEFGLIAEDQSTNVVVEADLVLPTRVTANTNFYAVDNISNPSAMRADGTIIIPEDGLYLLSMDVIASTSGGAAGALETTIFKNSGGTFVNQYAIAELYTSGTNIQAEGITSLIEVEKGDEINIRLLKGVTESNIVYGTNMKPKVRLVKVKSTEVKLTAKDLYNEYVNDLEVGVKPQSFDSYVKALMQREAMHMECKIPTVTLGAGTIIKNLAVTQGEDLLEDSTKLTAHVSGLYHVHILAQVSSQSTSRIGLMKNTTNYYDDLWVAVSETDQKHVFQNSLDTTIWLNAGDYITIANVYAVTDLQGTVEFSLIPCGTDTINQFNVWIPDEEYNLGNGLYGVRKVVQGTTNSNMVIDLSQYNIAKLEKIEGTADVDNGVTSALIPCYYTTVAFINVYYNKPSSELHLVRGTQYSKATDVFDFSLIYTKNS